MRRKGGVPGNQFHLKHGHNRGGNRMSPTYRTWDSMIGRCTRPSNASYPRYGGKGITVCERWRVFENFLADMGDRPEGRTLDRIDPSGNYEPGNCRWLTPKEQLARRRPRQRK